MRWELVARNKANKCSVHRCNRKVAKSERDCPKAENICPTCRKIAIKIDNARVRCQMSNCDKFAMSSGYCKKCTNSHILTKKSGTYTQREDLVGIGPADGGAKCLYCGRGYLTNGICKKCRERIKAGP